MLESENIAVAVMLAGCTAMGAVIWRLYSDREKSREDEKRVLREGIEREQSRTAELESISGVISSVQRAAVALDARVRAGFKRHDDHHKAIYKAIAKLALEREGNG